MQNRKHAFVLGSGIAGLSLAEILTRNGYRVTLVESAPELGGDASRSTQNWLHTGWLYATLPHDAAMRSCHEALNLFRRVYDAVLPAGIVNLERARDPRLYIPFASGRRGSWFSPEHVQYLYARSTYDVAPHARESWNRHLDEVTFARLQALGYPTTAASELHPGLHRLLDHWEGAPGGMDKYSVVHSTDARIDSRAILSSLLGLLGSETNVITNARYSLEREGDRTAVRIDGELHRPDVVVLATGKNTPHLLRSIDSAQLAGRFRSICSPVAVLDEALDLPSFIRFTPDLPETINHIKYRVGLREVSTVGSYDYYPADNVPEITPFVKKICRRLDISPSRVIGSYYGTKTELTGDLPRQYNHALEAVNANTFYAIAGKFSQFPLLVKELAEQLDLSLGAPSVDRGELACTIGATAPERLVAAHSAADEAPISRAA